MNRLWLKILKIIDNLKQELNLKISFINRYDPVIFTHFFIRHCFLKFVFQYLITILMLNTAID